MFFAQRINRMERGITVRSVFVSAMKDLNLVPAVGKAHIRSIRKLGIAYLTLALLFVVLGGAMCVFGVNHMAKYPFFGAVLFGCLAAFLLYFGLRYSKISQSFVDFLSVHIQIKDEWGNVWREIPYDDISHIEKERISGFFMGRNSDDFTADYICVYLHGCCYIPDGTRYAGLFQKPDFFPIAFNQEAYDYLLKRVAGNKTKGSACNDIS